MENKLNYQCDYIITFCTKYKMEILNTSVQKGLNIFFNEECSRQGYKIKNLSFTTYSVTMEISFPPTHSIQQVVGKLRRGSVEIIRQLAPETKTKLPNIWTNQYHAQTIGTIDRDRITDFINSQTTRNETRKRR